MGDVEIEYYADDSGKSPFARWFRKLNAEAATEVAFAVKLLENGTALYKSVGKGVQ